LNKYLAGIKKIEDIDMNKILGKNRKSYPPFLINNLIQFIHEIPKRGC
jgi:hypothetical protein